MVNTETILKILSIKGVGRKTALQLINRLPPGSINDTELLDYLLNSGVKLDNGLIKSGIAKANSIISESMKLKISFIDIHSPHYPRLLAEINDPPLVLSYKGDISLLKSTCIAIIGAREGTTRGYTSSFTYGKMLAQNGYTVVSGLAKGCDRFAHEGCLEVNGKTIAVFGTPLDSVYPYENKKLANEILLKGGLLISESLIGDNITPGSFLLRNRIQIGICNRIIAVEPNPTGGTHKTIDLCLKNNRKVGCIVNNRKTMENVINLSAKVQRLHNKNEVFKFLAE